MSSGASPLTATTLQVYTSPSRTFGQDQTFSPVTSSLLLGREEVVLVDAQFMEEDVAKLGDLIEESGRRLKTIFITHGHADHYFGADRLAERFADARVVATQGVVDYISAHWAADMRMFGVMFPNGLVLPQAPPQVLESGDLVLDGEMLEIIEVEQGDIAPSTVLYVPSIGAVIAGDVVYNGIHQMLGLSGPAEWERWIESVEQIAALHPKAVVAGHKRPDARDDEPDRILGGTTEYIKSFRTAAARAASPSELIKAMRAIYPEHGNLTTLIFSASSALKARSVEEEPPSQKAHSRRDESLPK